MEALIILVILENPHHTNFAIWTQPVGQMVAAFSERFGFDIFTKTINSAACGSVVATDLTIFTLVSSRLTHLVPNSEVWYPNFETQTRLSVESKITELKNKIFSADNCRSQSILPAQQKLLQKFLGNKEARLVVNTSNLKACSSVRNSFCNLLGHVNSLKGRYSVFDQTLCLQKPGLCEEPAFVSRNRLGAKALKISPPLMGHLIGLNLDQALLCDLSIIFHTMDRHMTNLLVDHVTELVHVARLINQNCSTPVHGADRTYSSSACKASQSASGTSTGASRQLSKKEKKRRRKLVKQRQRQHQAEVTNTSSASVSWLQPSVMLYARERPSHPNCLTEETDTLSQAARRANSTGSQLALAVALEAQSPVDPVPNPRQRPFHRGSARPVPLAVTDTDQAAPAVATAAAVPAPQTVTPPTQVKPVDTCMHDLSDLPDFR